MSILGGPKISTHNRLERSRKELSLNDLITKCCR